jgi:hypothetical protein
MAPQSVIRLRRRRVIAVELDRQESRGIMEAPTTQTIRDQGFLPLECDIPDGMTLSQYRALRARRPRARRTRLRRRLGRR